MITEGTDLMGWQIKGISDLSTWDGRIEAYQGDNG
jgi:hypothetical protein